MTGMAISLSPLLWARRLGRAAMAGWWIPDLPEVHPATASAENVQLLGRHACAIQATDFPLADMEFASIPLD